ncbi:MAG: hypothetical protein ABSA02_35635 [Trebonia sp.]
MKFLALPSSARHTFIPRWRQAFRYALTDPSFWRATITGSPPM